MQGMREEQRDRAVAAEQLARLSIHLADG